MNRLTPVGTSRAERLATGEVPTVRGFLATILAGGHHVERLDIGANARYAPYNRLVITNNSNVRLTIQLDGGNNVTSAVLARESRLYDGYWFHFFRVVNEDVATATGANAVEFTAERVQEGADSAIRKLIRRFVR